MRKMRRQDREVTDLNEILEIVKKCKVCRIGFYDQGEVYILPLNFGSNYADDTLTLYFHGATKGRKMDLLAGGPIPVGIEMDRAHELIENEAGCEHSYKFESVIGNGLAETIEDPAEKVEALNHIMVQLTGKSFEFPEKSVQGTMVFKVTLKHFSAKRLQ